MHGYGYKILILVFIKMQRRGDNALHIFVNSRHIVSDQIFRKFNNRRYPKKIGKTFSRVFF